MDVAAKSLDHVPLDVCFSGRDKRQHGSFGLNRRDTSGTNAQPDRLAASGAGRFHLGHGAKQWRQEQRIPSAPSVQVAAIDVQSMLRLRQGQTPESSDRALGAALDAVPPRKHIVHCRYGHCARGRQLLRRYRPTLRKQPVKGKRSALFRRRQLRKRTYDCVRDVIERRSVHSMYPMSEPPVG